MIAQPARITYNFRNFTSKPEDGEKEVVDVIQEQKQEINDVKVEAE